MPNESLQYLPTTTEELFRFLSLMVKIPDKEHNYCLPWIGWVNSSDARKRLLHFEKDNPNVVWKPFNNSEYNEGPMTLNSCPGRAMIERITNGWDACLELKALGHKGPMPSNPQEAVKLWFDLDRKDFISTESRKKLSQFAAEHLELRAFCSKADDYKNNVVDVRDYGIGMTANEMTASILTLNHGNKAEKAYLTGKHGQGASSTYQYSDLTIIVSRKHNEETIAFTIVEKQWGKETGDKLRVPTYRYLTINGEIPILKISEEEFKPGTLVRHIGYEGKFQNPFGHESFRGLLDRSLAQPLIPIRCYYHYLYETGTDKSKKHLIGYEDKDLCRGSINVLERLYEKTLKSPPGALQDDVKISYKAKEVFHLGNYNFGLRVGVQNAGYVTFTYWVANLAPKDGNIFDVMKHWVTPSKPILFTLDGQTNTEEDRLYITSQTGAGLWAIGKTMVIQVDCDHLSNYAKYEMFTSTREHLKDTDLKNLILDELVRRLKRDERLAVLNSQRANASFSQSKDDTSLSERLKKYLKNTGLSFTSFLRRVRTYTPDYKEELVSTRGERTPEEPIESVEPPTFIRWKIKNQPFEMYPSQKYSWVIETNASPSYWNPEDLGDSKIQLLTHNVNFIGGGEMRGGRIRCHFQCPEKAKIGSKGMIQVSLKIDNNTSLPPKLLEIIVVPQKPKKKPQPTGEMHAGKGDKKGNGSNGKVIHVPVMTPKYGKEEWPLLKPIPIYRDTPSSLWSSLGWPFDTASVGFSIKKVGNQIHLYYNADLPALIDSKHKMAARKLEGVFQDRFEIHLLMNAIFQLNHGFIDEEELPQEARKPVQMMSCASAESSIYSARAEIELELRLGKDDWDTMVESGIPSDNDTSLTSSSILNPEIEANKIIDELLNGS